MFPVGRRQGRQEPAGPAATPTCSPLSPTRDYMSRSCPSIGCVSVPQRSLSRQPPNRGNSLVFLKDMLIPSDYLIVGSGLAGLYFAIRAAHSGASVSLVTRKGAEESNTRYAQGGIAAVVSDEDSAEAHIRDTLQAGAGLCDPEVVEVTVREGPRHVAELLDMGAGFSRMENGQLSLGREGGHSHHRVVHADEGVGVRRVAVRQRDSDVRGVAGDARSGLPRDRREMKRSGRECVYLDVTGRDPEETPLRHRRGRPHRPARRQPAGRQLPARGPGIRGTGHGAIPRRHGRGYGRCRRQRPAETHVPRRSASAGSC